MTAPTSREDLAASLLELVQSLSVESAYHLRCALDAASVPGVGGSLVIELPRRVGEHPKVKWMGGSNALSLPV